MLNLFSSLLLLCGIVSAGSSEKMFHPNDSSFTLSIPAKDDSPKQDIIFVKGGCDVDVSQNPDTTVRSLLWNYPSAGQILSFYENESASKAKSPYARITVTETGYSLRLCNLAKSMVESNYKLEVFKPSMQGVLLTKDSVVFASSSASSSSGASGASSESKSRSRELAQGSDSLIDRKVRQIKKDVGVKDDEIIYLNANSGENMTI